MIPRTQVWVVIILFVLVAVAVMDISVSVRTQQVESNATRLAVIMVALEVIRRRMGR